MKHLSIDIETFSPVNLAKSGVYRYCDTPEFEVLLFAYSADGGPVHVVDLASGEKLPEAVRLALTDPTVIKWEFNAQFERVCLSKFLGTLICGLVCGFCSSGQRFAAAFLQIPPHGGHPWPWLYPSHCRADSGLSPVRTCAHRAH